MHPPHCPYRGNTSALRASRGVHNNKANVTRKRLVQAELFLLDCTHHGNLDQWIDCFTAFKFPPVMVTVLGIKTNFSEHSHLRSRKMKLYLLHDKDIYGPFLANNQKNETF